MARKSGGKSRNDFKRKEDRKDKAMRRQAARGELEWGAADQLELLIDRGHGHCKEAHRLAARIDKAFDDTAKAIKKLKL